MNLKAFCLTAAMSLVPAAALGEDCSKTEIRGKALELARAAYSEIMNPYLEPTVTIEQLMEVRAKERTCKGQETLNYLLMLMQIERGELQTAVSNLEILLQTDAEPMEKRRMMSTLISRLVVANDIRAAIAFSRRARDAYPDQASEYNNNLILLLAGTRQFEEARALADQQLENAVSKDLRTDQIPYAAWVRLAVSEVSGDAADRNAVIARLETHFGDSTAALLDRDRDYSDFASLLFSRFNPKASIQPIAPPKPSYPQAMQIAGISGNCDIQFDIGIDGVPENVTGECSHPGFLEESMRAISTLKFEIATIDGKPRRYYNVVYPFEFNIY